MRQEILEMDVDSNPSFNNYWAEANSNNKKISTLLQATNLSTGLNANYFLVGEASAGKSHLLQSLYDTNPTDSQLIDLEQTPPLGSMLDYKIDKKILLIDHIDHIHHIDKTQHSNDLQMELFRLYNSCLESDTTLIIAGRTVPNHLPIELNDLKSRLQTLTLLPLSALTDDQKSQALRFRAKRQGLLFDDKTLNYLMMRSSRDFKTLMHYLSKFSQEGLRHQKKLSISLIKETLNW